MDVHPVVVPVKLFRVPKQQRLFIFTNPAKQRAEVVGAENVGVLVRERPEDVECLGGFAGDFFDPVNIGFHRVDYIKYAASAPTRTDAIEQGRDFLCGGVQHRSRGGFKPPSRHGPWFHPRRNLVDER